MVSSIVDFGAFVDLGGVDGLVHVSELSWKHIDHPGEVVEVGQEVTVEVLDVDMDRERVSLSLKSTQEDPWQQFARTHQIGQVVPGRVTKLVPFGAFVRVEEGIEGLVHISELADRHVGVPKQGVQVGDEIFVKIIDIDLDRRRISLSLKQANEGTIGEAVGDDFDPTLYGTSRPPTTSRVTTSTRRASTRRPASGCPATRSSARSGSTSTPRRGPGSRRTAVRWRSPGQGRRGGSSGRQRPGEARPTAAAPAAPARAAPARVARPARSPPARPGCRCHRHAGFRRGPSGPAREAVRRPELVACAQTQQRECRAHPLGGRGIQVSGPSRRFSALSVVLMSPVIPQAPKVDHPVQRSWLIRAMRLIWCTIDPQIHHEARINHGNLAFLVLVSE